MANKPPLRFAIVDDAGRPFSSVWRLWNTKDDVYIGIRKLVQIFKTSLHASGRHRHAFASDENAVRFRGPGQDRAVQKWERPAPQHELATLLFQVAFPGLGLGEYLPNYSLPSELVSLPRVAEDAVGFVSVGDVQGQTRTVHFGETPARIIYRSALPKGTELVVTWHTEPLTSEIATALREFADRLPSFPVEPGLDREDPGTRSFLITQNTDGIGRLIDVGIRSVVEWAGRAK